jgi:UDP-2,3-diacylglucosamine pyrophosphatase LpxH
MALRARQVYVISDLHLGGVYPSGDDPNDRGFRICTRTDALVEFVDTLIAKSDPIELIINGDVVDFLAERGTDDSDWVPFTSDQASAAEKLRSIIRRDALFFDALARLLEHGHRLTLLQGNHDIELALPKVRQVLCDALRLTGRSDFRFIYDGEAYPVGNALIEHGNRYDAFNVVDNDALRRIRSLLSRNQDVPAQYAFGAPAGSHMVTSCINPIKVDYKFIDLLKPETESVIPILLTLEPGYRSVLTTAAKLALAARKHRLQSAAMPSFGGDIHAGRSSEMDFGSDISAPAAPVPDELDVLLRGVLQGDAELVLAGSAASGANAGPQIGSDISARETISRLGGMARLLTSRNSAGVDSRLPALLASVRALQNDTTFARDAECLPEYLHAAAELATRGFDFVVFGHTHMPRDIRLAGGARYLNSGTWADVIKFPTDIVAGPKPQALEKLRAFVEDLGAGRLSGWTSFLPTYVRLDLGTDGKVATAALCDYTGPNGI